MMVSDKQRLPSVQRIDIVAKMPRFGGVPKVEVELSFANVKEFYDDFRESLKAQLRAKGVPNSYCITTPSVEITNIAGRDIEEPMFEDYPITIKLAIPYADVQAEAEPDVSSFPSHPATIILDSGSLPKKKQVSITEAHRILVLTKQQKWREVRDMLERNSDLLHFRFKDGWTLLHHAVLLGDLRTIYTLALHSSDLNAKTSEGFTPSEFAQSPETRKLLDDASQGRVDIFWSFAEAIADEGCHVDDAVPMFEQRLAEEELKVDHEGQAKAHYHIGRSKGNLADYSGERRAYEAALAALRKAGMDRSEFAAEVAMRMASICPDRTSADKLFTEARAILADAGANRSKTGAQLLMRSGAKKRVRGDFSGAFADLSVAVALLRELNSMKSRLGLDALLALSRTKRDMRNFAGEKATADEALEIADAIGICRTSSGADVLVSVAMAQENVGDVQGALATYSEVKGVLEAIQKLDTAGGGSVLFNMGCLQAKLGRFEVSLRLFREALSIYARHSPQEVEKCERAIASCSRR